MNNEILNTKEYAELINELKIKVRSTQLRAALSVNKEVIFLYLEIGKSLLERQQKYKWGDKFLENVASDLNKEFLNMKGFSLRNLKYMRQFSLKFSDLEIGQQSAAQLLIPWGHHMLLLDKGLDKLEYLWYAEQSIINGWSRNILSLKLETKLFHRQTRSKQINNFDSALPPSQSDLANDLVKDPYVLPFIDEARTEREFEKLLISHIQKFLLELGKGFAFVGSQYPLDVDGESFFLDLLFYHIKLKAYVVIELKNGKFKPEYAGKLNFYLNVLDNQLKEDSDNSSIGIILCKEKNKIVAEYALHGIKTPMGISSYEIQDTLPETLKDSLPTPEELERELQQIDK